MSVGIVAFSERGLALGARIQAYFTEKNCASELTRCKSGGLSDWTMEHFHRDDALIFIGSCGIAVRAVAPYIKSKSDDPAVVVLDELAFYAVSLLSGHLGGANKLTAELARFTGAAPVITTATDRNGIFAIDSWARDQELIIANPEQIKSVSAKLLTGEVVRIKSLFPVAGSTPSGIVLGGNAYDALISHRVCGMEGILHLIPRTVTVGIGCRKGVGAKALETAFKAALEKADCHELAVCRVCSIDIKADEPGILEFCRMHELPYRTFSASELAAVSGAFTSSEFVESITGIDNVCERAAVLGSGGSLIIKKQTGNGVTMALAMSEPELSFEENT